MTELTTEIPLATLERPEIKRPARSQFRVKLIVAFSALAVLITGGALLTVRRAAQEAARERVEGDFRHGMQILKDLADARMAALGDSINAALADPNFRAQVGKASDQSLNQDMGLAAPASSGAIGGIHQVFVSSDLPQFHKYGVLAILGADATVLFTKARKDFFGTRSTNPLIRKALTNGKALGLWSSEDRELVEAGFLPRISHPELFLVIAQSLVAGGRTLGVVLAGEAVSADLLPRLEQSAHASIGFATPEGKLIADPSLRAQITWMLRAREKAPSKPEGEVSSAVIGTARHLALSAPIAGMSEADEIGRAFMFRPIEAELRAFETKVNAALLPILLLSLAFALIVASVIARRLTGPLVELERGVRAVQAGDLSIQIRVWSEDELGALGHAMNEMIAGLREKNLDGLTRIFNKRYLLDSLEGMCKRARQHSLPLSLLFFDLDHFKKVNDNHGHEAGDFVLKEFSKLVQAKFKRREDVFARYGGEEFVVVMMDRNLDSALAIAEEIRAMICDHHFVFEGVRLAVTTSMGVSRLTEKIDSPVALLKAADRALYVSKNGGRNRVTAAAETEAEAA